MLGIAKKIVVASLAIALFAPFAAFAAPSSVDRITDHIEPLIKTDYIKGLFFTATSTTATSTLPRLSVQTAIDLFGTFANSLDDLCVAITGGSGLCDGSDATGAGGGAAAVATSTGETAGNLAYWTSTNATPATLGKVATSSITINAPLTSAGTAGFVVGGSGWTLDVDDIGAADLANADFGDFSCNGTTCTVDASAITVGKLASADFGDFTCNGSTCTTDNGSIGVADLASVDFGDFTCNGSACTVDANSIALTTDTTGDYTAGISSSGSITVGNGTGEGASATVNLNMGNANTWTALQTFANASTTGMATFGHASSTQWSGGGLAGDCDSDAQTLGWDLTTKMFVCGDDDSGVGGGITVIKEGDSDVVTGATAIDFGAGFDVAAVVTEGDVTLDLVEYNGAASTTQITSNYASTTVGIAGTLTISTSLTIGGDTIDEFVGSGLALSSGDLTVDNVTAAMLNAEDFGDFSCNGTTCTIDANSVALTTDTTGNYVLSLADDGQSTVTVTNGVAEGGAATLRVIDVVCTDCLTTTEIADSYLLNTGDVGTGDFDFGGADSLEIVNGTGCTVNALGEICLDSTDNQLLVGDSGNAAAVFGRKEVELYRFDLASTSPRFVSGAYQPLPAMLDAYTVTSIACYVTSGTSKQIIVSDGTNDMDTITCGTTLTEDDGSIANSTVTAGELMRVKMVTTSGAVDSVSVTILGTLTRE